MSATLADFLIELSDPDRLAAFRGDPEGHMVAAGLSDADKAAIRSQKSGWIRYQARVGTSEASPEELQYGGVTAQVLALDVIDVIDVVDVVVIAETEA